LTVDEVTLTCDNVPAFEFEGFAITPPALTCSHGTLGTPAWTNAPDWSNPAPDTYSNISATATCGLATKTADCSGILAVDEVTLTCGSVPTDGISGIAITPPTLTCSHGASGTPAWSVNAPNWSSPAHGTYSNISVTANCGLAIKTVDCSGSLIVSCTANDNTSTHYCSNGTMKEYGFVTYSEQTYKTIVIGEQIWMAENLNYNPSTGNFACYYNLDNNCTTYGRLYDWSTAMGINASYNSSYWNGSDVNHQGICPDGWHIPSNVEWGELVNAVGSSAGIKLKATNGWNSNGNGTDDYGFSALPGGEGINFYSYGYGFGNIGDYGCWRSASENGNDYSQNWCILYNSSSVAWSNNTKSDMLSVRCVRRNLCGGLPYTSSQFCSANAIYNKCGGTVEFTPGMEECCGSNKYTLATQFCYNNSNVVERCGGTGAAYTPGTEACCGNNKYTLSTQRCENNIVETQCGSGWYNASDANFRCNGNVVETYCGSGWINLNSLKITYRIIDSV